MASPTISKTINSISTPPTLFGRGHSTPLGEGSNVMPDCPLQSLIYSVMVGAPPVVHTQPLTPVSSTASDTIKYSQSAQRIQIGLQLLTLSMLLPLQHTPRRQWRRYRALPPSQAIANELVLHVRIPIIRPPHRRPQLPSRTLRPGTARRTVGIRTLSHHCRRSYEADLTTVAALPSARRARCAFRSE